jgi:hypothetical protein
MRAKELALECGLLSNVLIGHEKTRIYIGYNLIVQGKLHSDEKRKEISPWHRLPND